MFSPTSSDSSASSTFERVDSPFSSDGSDVLGEHLLEHELLDESVGSESSESSVVLIDEQVVEPLDETLSSEASESDSESDSEPELQEVMGALNALELVAEPTMVATNEFNNEPKIGGELGNADEIDALEKAKIENALRKVQISTWRNNGVMRESFQNLRRDLSGTWKIVDSINIAEYLNERKSSEINDLLFQLADVHFEFSLCENYVTTHQKVNDRRYHERCLKLSEPVATPLDGWITFINGNRLETIYLAGDQKDTEVRYVENGRLFVEWRRFGVTCTRIYERLDKIRDLPAQLAAQQEIMEDMKLTLHVQADALKRIPELTSKLAEANSKIKMLERAATPAKTIRDNIVGKWRKTGGGVSYVISFKVDGEKVLVKPPYESKYCAKQLNCLVARGKFSQRVYIENDTLVMCDYHNGEELGRCERSVTDGKLVAVVYSKGVKDHESVYERVGEPA